MRTRVGYAGGTTIDPTYHDLADHTEVFQLDYDPRILSYAELLDAIWTHRRGGRSSNRQYMDAVFCATAEHAAIARSKNVTAPIITGARFYLAEDYHQKYYLRHDSMLMRELAAYSPQDFVESTVAARLNGYVAGNGTLGMLREDLPRLGLSAAANAHLERLVGMRARIACGTTPA